MMRRALIAFLLGFLILPVAGAESALDNSGKSVDKAADKSADPLSADAIAKNYAQLADIDPIKRSAARRELLGLKKDQVPALKQAVATTQPATLSQAAALRDIVVHVHVRDAIGFGTKGDKVFLGVNTPEYEEYDRPPAIGCLISEPFVGFAAYRYLDAGDMVIAASLSGAMRPVNNFDDFAKILRPAHVGDTVTMIVMRGRAKLEVSFPLESNPLILTSRNANASADQANSVTSTRLKPLIRDANRYFDKEFGPLLPQQQKVINGFEPTDDQLKQSPRPGHGSAPK